MRFSDTNDGALTIRYPARDQQQPSASLVVEEVEKKFAGEALPVLRHCLETVPDATKVTEAGIRLAVLHLCHVCQSRQQHGNMPPDQFTAAVLEQRFTGAVAIADHPAIIQGQHGRIIFDTGRDARMPTANCSGGNRLRLDDAANRVS